MPRRQDEGLDERSVSHGGREISDCKLPSVPQGASKRVSFLEESAGTKVSGKTRKTRASTSMTKVKRGNEKLLSSTREGNGGV